MSVTLHTTLGDLKLEIFCDSVPKTAYNFLALCASSYYTASPFHRSIPSFILQAGAPAPAPSTHPTAPSDAPQPVFDPKTHPGTSVYGAHFEDEIRPALRHNARGVVSSANKGPDTNGSQFFICYAAAPHLDGKNTVFGRVIEGAEEGGVLGRFEALEVDRKNRPRERVVIEGVTVHANPLAEQ